MKGCLCAGLWHPGVAPGWVTQHLTAGDLSKEQAAAVGPRRRVRVLGGKLGLLPGWRDTKVPDSSKGPGPVQGCE